MPVIKRAARPTVATAPDPRDPQSSENDFTVLFDRKRTDQFVRTFAQARQVERPRPAPRPPFPDRSKSNAVPRIAPDRDREDDANAIEATNSSAPAAVVVPSREPIKTVSVPPRLRARVFQVATFLALGGLMGIGVESFARHPAPRPAADPVPLVQTEAPPPPIASVPSVASALPAAGPESREPPTGASITVSSDKVAIVPPVHHHHHHHAVPGSPALAASSGAPAASADAGVDVDDDDVNAAIQTLTKAKGEVTLP